MTEEQPALYVRARDAARHIVGQRLFPPRPDDYWRDGKEYGKWRETRADWAALRDAVLAECRRFPPGAEALFRAFLNIPAFTDESEEAAWRAAQKHVRASCAASRRLLMAKEREKKQKARLRRARMELRRCTCQHCPVHSRWALAMKARLQTAAKP